MIPRWFDYRAFHRHVVVSYRYYGYVCKRWSKKVLSDTVFALA